MTPRRMATVRTLDDFQGHLAAYAVDLPVDPELAHGPDAPLAQPYPSQVGPIGNRFAILPMEGWDGTTDGHPSALTIRRWQKFGRSGAKLIWGGEAVAVRPDGRANPNQLLIDADHVAGLGELREALVAAHREAMGSTDGLVVGLQLTHSGRFARPNLKTRPEPVVAFRHPHLDRLVGIASDAPVLSDDEVARLVDAFVRAAVLSAQAGYDFVDIKHCHGYLGHEFLSAVDRPGRFGGSFENRTRFLREVVAGIRAEAPGLAIGVRVSIFDLAPFRPGPGGEGESTVDGVTAYPYAFGGDGTGRGIDLTEVSALFTMLEDLEIELVCTTAGVPYHNPHITRPAAFPPSDGYKPPEDPIVGVARQVAATAWLKACHPNLAIVGSGYTYLQDWLPKVGQAAVRRGMVDFVGLGRMVLSYPELPRDVLDGRPLARKHVCRTFSDCTTAPRNGMVSGCYPLDPSYKTTPERDQIEAIKRAAAERLVSS